MRGLLFLIPALLFAEIDPSLLTVSAGVFDVTRKNPTALIQLEYRFDRNIYKRSFATIRPLVGAMATVTGAGYFFGGLLFDFQLTPQFFGTLTFSPGIYLHGSGKNLGSWMEFRSSAEVAYRFKSGARTGVQFYHLSNGSFSSKNPGSECLAVFYGFPF